jgi:hypothetical protein
MPTTAMGTAGRGDLDVAAETLLQSWNDTPTRQAIIDFVQAVGGEGSPDFVAPAERVAVFDNDGTWTWPPRRGWRSCGTEPRPDG